MEGGSGGLLKDWGYTAVELEEFGAQALSYAQVSEPTQPDAWQLASPSITRVGWGEVKNKSAREFRSDLCVCIDRFNK